MTSILQDGCVNSVVAALARLFAYASNRILNSRQARVFIQSTIYGTTTNSSQQSLYYQYGAVRTISTTHQPPTFFLLQPKTTIGTAIIENKAS